MTPNREELQQQMNADAYRAANAAYRYALRASFAAHDAIDTRPGVPIAHAAATRAIAAGDALRKAHSRLMRARLNVRPGENPEPAADRIYRAEHRDHIRRQRRNRTVNPRTVAAHERRTR